MTRVVLAEMPRMLRAIVESALGAAPDVAVAAEGASVDDAADVVIVAEPSPRGDAHAATLYAHPRLRVVGVATDGRGATLYELRPQRIPLGALSPETLVEVVRARRGGSD